MRSDSSGPLASRFRRAALRSSPWIVIALAMHVLVLAIASVVYFAHGRRAERALVTTIAIAPPRVEQAPIEEPPVPFVRDGVPDLPPSERSEADLVVEFDPDFAALVEGPFTGEPDPADVSGFDNPDPDALSTLPPGAAGGTSIGVGPTGHRGFGVSPFEGRGRGGKDGGGTGPKLGRHSPEQPETEIAVLSALQWLARHQSADGRWDADGFMENCRANTCDGPGSSAHDVGVTGLALLCFLGAGHTHEPGPFRKTVANGLRFLRDAQDGEGCFGERIGHQFLYDHACAALAMAEAYAMTDARVLREPAQAGIRFVHLAQNPYGAWRYDVPPSGDDDTSVTGWMVMALKSAKWGGLTIDDAALQGALNWVDEVTDPASGRTGYTTRGGLPSRLGELRTRFPAEKSESMTAVGLLTRIFAGRGAADDARIEQGAKLLDARRPEWDEAGGAIDFYYWYYGTLAMFQLGGPRWERWNASMKSAVIDHQRDDPAEDEYGSWDPVDPWSSIGGRVYATALNCLCMEVYYRYPRVFGAGPRGADEKPR